AGCAGIQQQPLREGPPQANDRRFLDVPFFPDRSDQCGPSVLASVLTFWHHPVDPPTLKKEIFLAHLKGSLPMDLLLAAKSRGFKAHLYNGSIEDLKYELGLGLPMIAYVTSGFDFFPIGHYVVITGYDEARQGLTLHSGMKKDRFMSFRSFLGDWVKTERS